MKASGIVTRVCRAGQTICECCVGRVRLRTRLRKNGASGAAQAYRPRRVGSTLRPAVRDVAWQD